MAAPALWLEAVEAGGAVPERHAVAAIFRIHLRVEIAFMLAACESVTPVCEQTTLSLIAC